MNTVQPRLSAALGLLLCLTPALPASAQDVTSASGPLYIVHTEDGSALAGRGLVIDNEMVRLLVERQLREVPLTEVQRIDRKGDSLKNGVLIGGGIFGGLCALACLQGVDDRAMYARVVATNTAIGALIGLIVDWRTQGTTVVYRANGRTARRDLPRVVPAMTAGRSALALRWHW